MYEAQVHEELSQLVGDSGALHKFLEAALRLESHAFESALGPVSPSLVHLTETNQGGILVGSPTSSSPNRKKRLYTGACVAQVGKLLNLEKNLS